MVERALFGFFGFARVLALWLPLAGLWACERSAQFPEPVPPERPERIVSLSVGADEMVLSLVGRERVVGVSRYTLLPERSHVAELARGLRGVSHREAESLLALDPDLVVLSVLASRELELLLERAGVPALRMRAPRDLDDLRQALRTVSDGVGEPERGRALIAELEAQVAALRALPPLGRSALYLGPEESTAGRGTTTDWVLRLAGLRNAAAEFEGHPRASLEWILETDPDFVLVPTGDAALDAYARALPDDPRLRGLRALRQGRVLALPARELSSISHFLPAAARALRERIAGRLGASE